MKNFFNNIKDKITKSDAKTFDEEYDMKKLHIENATKLLTLILQHIQKTVDGYKANQVIQNELSNKFCTLYNDGPVIGCMRNYEDSVNRFGDEQQRFADLVNSDVVEPLKSYLEIFKDVKKRMDELSKRKSSMDSFNSKRLKLAESATANKEKLPEIDSKYRHAKANYEALLGELKSDLGALEEDINSFISPIFANFIRYQNEYLQAVSGLFGSLPGQCANVNGDAVHNHQSVITPLELSAMTNAAQVQVDEPARPRTNSSAANNNNRALPPRPGARAPPSVRAKAMYDFTASDSSELSFREGDVLNILERNGDWWQAELNGRRGQVPSNYLEIVN